jgi:hypothetical protein
MRLYQAVTENLPVFHEFFCAFLLPVQLRHGARLVGAGKPRMGGWSRSGSTTTGPPTNGSKRLSARTLILAEPRSTAGSYPR